jgi:cytidine deaminase
MEEKDEAKQFDVLLEKAKELAKKRKLSDYATCGHVACAMLTKEGNIYTGISTDFNCSLGNCAEYSAVVEMLKNNESEIVKMVAYSARGKIYAPCGRCREVIRMVNDKNVDTKVMLGENNIVTIKELLPNMYITAK